MLQFISPNTIVTEPNGKLEVNIEAEPNNIGDVIKAEVESQSKNRISVETRVLLPEDADVLANGRVKKFEGVSEMEETKIAQPEANNEVKENTKTVAEVTEPGELELNAEENETLNVFKAAFSNT
ncbi:hypothetical protein Tco_1404075 [Tanacetum coccineum]